MAVWEGIQCMFGACCKLFCFSSTAPNTSVVLEPRKSLAARWGPRPMLEQLKARFWGGKTLRIELKLQVNFPQWNSTERYTCTRRICTTIYLKPAVRNGPALSQKAHNKVCSSAEKSISCAITEMFTEWLYLCGTLGAKHRSVSVLIYHYCSHEPQDRGLTWQIDRRHLHWNKVKQLKQGKIWCSVIFFPPVSYKELFAMHS